MKMMNSATIRQTFLNFFKQKQHMVVPSGLLVPQNDPTLLFVNAGMVPFKETFLGLETRPYSRAVSVQRCVRAGGKHNDLDQVGYTARHHTFFEMLGNFSFGDYFKREAIQYAWEFLTGILNIPQEKLWITIHERDDEAAAIWLHEIGISAERFSRCGDEDNFWSMGDTGPCGPCTEIYYDHGPHIPGGPPGSPDAAGDRYVEIWNLVFMQYNRDASGVLHPLDKPSIDTGMGLERIAAVMQGVHSNYDTDIFKSLKQSIQALAQTGEKISLQSVSLNVIADHIRASTFLMLDGVVPSNEGRGYVLRRIIRRAVRHGHHLKLPMPFLTQLVEPLAGLMGDAYPVLHEKTSLIQSLLLQEETQFAHTLENGLALLNHALAELKQPFLPGAVAFKLYDTYGFPLDLTEDILREKGMQVDIDGFNACMAKQRLLSQSKGMFQVDYTTLLPFTESSTFEGYQANVTRAIVTGLRVEGKPVDSLTPGVPAMVVLDTTPFYPESGGQVGDTGEIAALSSDALFKVLDTKRVGHAIVHQGELLVGRLDLQDTVTARIDVKRRDNIRINHTATHLLHAALKEVLGNQVEQKGSLVDVERARFDFSYDTALTDEQLLQIEDRVNEHIRLNEVVKTELMSMQDAVQSGAVALFGEKYADTVRVLSMGAFSKELCGGTHAKQTGDIGLFKITAEYGVARGVRRIEFVTGAYALLWIREQSACLNSIASHLKVSPTETLPKLLQILQENKQLARDLQHLKQQIAADSGRQLLLEFKTLGHTPVLIKCLDEVAPNSLRTVLDTLKSQVDNAVIVLVGVVDTKLYVIASVSQSALENGAPKASELVKALCGRGGGRDHMAQGGGDKPEDLATRIQATWQLLQSVLG